MTGRRDAFVDHVVDQLGGDVRARPVFGGHGLYWGGAMFGIVYESTLYLKVDDDWRERYEAAGSACFSPRPGQRLTSFYAAPADVVDDRDELQAWAAAARRAAARAR